MAQGAEDRLYERRAELYPLFQDAYQALVPTLERLGQMREA